MDLRARNACPMTDGQYFILHYIVFNNNNYINNYNNYINDLHDNIHLAEYFTYKMLKFKFVYSLEYSEHHSSVLSIFFLKSLLVMSAAFTFNQINHEVLCNPIH